jgi:hypothetical protein
MFNRHKFFVPTLVLLIGISFSQYVMAHAMVAQHGTLNFVDDGIYMVLSLPVSAFEGTDDDKDGKLSKVEFARHQSSIAKLIRSKVGVSDEQGKLTLKGLILSPVSSHDQPQAPSLQLIVMGKFELHDNKSPLQYQMALFGNDATEQAFKVTANDKAKGLRQVITFTPNKTAITLFKA